MSLDDLRARMHAHAKALHELDVDVHAAEMAFAARREQLSAEANGLATALQNYTPTPDPTQSAAPVRFARFIYNNPDITAKWTVQVVQGQPDTVSRIPALRQAGVLNIHRYAFPLTWSAHEHYGYRSAVDPAQFNQSWLALRNGAKIPSSKFSSGPGYPNYLIDVGWPAYQQASADWLIRKCRTEGYNGVYLDEINERLAYAGYAVPSRYGTDYQFQQAVRAYVEYVAAALRGAGFSCHANLASNANAWRDHVAEALDGVCVEFFMAQHTVEDAWHVASIENGEWKRQLDWLLWNELRNKTTICQADARSEAEVQYALCSLLLVTTGKALLAATKGGAGLTSAWWAPAMDTALLLGRPLGAYTTQPSGICVRQFEHGTVSVNPTQKPINTMPATSGLIEVR